MPTVLREPPLRVVLYPNDHRPAHVHVMGPGAEAVFELGCPLGPLRLRESLGFSATQIGRIRRWLTQELKLLCERWRNLHGYYH